MEKILEKLEKLISSAESNLKDINDPKDLEKARIDYLGRKSELTDILRSIKDLKPEEKGTVGKRGNEVKVKLEELIAEKEKEQQKQKLGELAKDEWIDITAPGQIQQIGHLSPLTQMQQYAEEIFQNMGFEIVHPYLIDNFSSLNIPKDHPARDAWDTFWVEDDNILITHTSSMQNRIFKDKEPPIKVIVPGTSFRNEATDARHEHTFIQIEGVYVDKGITLSDMVGTLEAFFESFYEKDIDVKFTPDYFPFVEPGVMISLTCVLCDGLGCKVCKQSGWLEVFGCGMIHPNVLEEGGIDSKVYSGFAWGIGLERLIMLKYGIEDIKHFRSGDLRFVKQF
jgi:phenylalanyl-tRNA synthetase alpha chain